MGFHIPKTNICATQTGYGRGVNGEIQLCLAQNKEDVLPFLRYSC